MTPQEKDLLPKAGEDPALKAPPKKDLVQSARDFLGNAFGGKNTDLNATVEQFTAEMTLVAEGLSQDQTRLSEQADRLSAQQTLLEDRSRSLNAARDLCDHLAAGAASLAELDPDECLAAAMQQQKKGVCFVDIKKQDTKRKKYLGALLGAGSFLVIMLFVLAILIWAFVTDPQNAPPLPIAAFLFAVIKSSLSKVKR